MKFIVTPGGNVNHSLKKNEFIASLLDHRFATHVESPGKHLTEFQVLHKVLHLLTSCPRETLTGRGHTELHLMTGIIKLVLTESAIIIVPTNFTKNDP